MVIVNSYFNRGYNYASFQYFYTILSYGFERIERPQKIGGEAARRAAGCSPYPTCRCTILSAGFSDGFKIPPHNSRAIFCSGNRTV